VPLRAGSDVVKAGVDRSGAGDETRTRDIQLGRNVLGFVFTNGRKPRMSTILALLRSRGVAQLMQEVVEHLTADFG